MNLGDGGRKAIKGHDLDYYLNILHETVNTPSPNSANEMTSGSYPPIQSNSIAARR